MTDKIKAIIPAAPGFDIVAVLFSDPPEFQYYAIVAWIIEDDKDDGQSAIPVSPDWAENGRNKIIRQPDGTIIFQDGPIFTKGHEAEALAYAVKAIEKREAAKRPYGT
jgi:hypothetical protein